MVCEKCGLAQTDPVPTEDALDQYYSGEYYGTTSQKFNPVMERITEIANKKRAKFLHSLLKKNKPENTSCRILDIGCGRGNLLKELSRLGCECHGIEREGFRPDESDTMDDIYLHSGKLDGQNFPDGYFDMVIIWHVLEHLDNPFNTLDEARGLLSDGALIVISVPNYSSFQSVVFGQHWFHLDIPRHLYHFNPDALRQMLVKRDFSIMSSATCSLEQGIFGFIQSAFNSIGFTGRPNRFYQSLKAGNYTNNALVISAGALGASVLLPAAILEYILSCLLHNGVVITIIARKNRLKSIA
jgi:SAM-dependent methyltransferase